MYELNGLGSFGRLTFCITSDPYYIIAIKNMCLPSQYHIQAIQDIDILASARPKGTN